MSVFFHRKNLTLFTNALHYVKLFMPEYIYLPEYISSEHIYLSQSSYVWRFMCKLKGYNQACPWECHSHGNPMGNVPWDGTGQA